MPGARTHAPSCRSAFQMSKETVPRHASPLPLVIAQIPLLNGPERGDAFQQPFAAKPTERLLSQGFLFVKSQRLVKILQVFCAEAPKNSHLGFFGISWEYLGKYGVKLGPSRGIFGQ